MARNFGPVFQKQVNERKSNKRRTRETEARQCEKVERHPFYCSWKIRSSRKPSKKSRKRLELPMEAVVSCKLKTKKRPNKLQVTDSETTESNKLQKTKHACMVQAHASTRKSSERNLSKRSRRPHCRTGVQIFKSLQSRAQVRSHPPGDANSGCKSSSGQRMGEARKVASLAHDQSKE